MGRRTIEEKDVKDLPALPVLSPGVEDATNTKGTIMTSIKDRMRSVYPAGQSSRTSQTKKWVAYALVAALVVIGTPSKSRLIHRLMKITYVAVILGAVVGTKQHKSNGSNSSNESGGSGTPNFPLDSRLHNSFWGYVKGYF